MKPTLLDIFAGIGGFSLAFESAGFETLAFVEFNETKRIMLNDHWPEKQIYGDIDIFDCGEFFRTHGRPDVIAGGVPCQPTSQLGARLGTADARWKWPQAIRLVRELRPHFAVFENPPALLSLESGRAFNGILSQMAEIGYDGWWDVIPAAAFGAGHWRKRLCIVFADSNNIGITSGFRKWKSQEPEAGECDSILPFNPNGERCIEARGSLPIRESRNDIRGQSAEDDCKTFPSDTNFERWERSRKMDRPSDSKTRENGENNNAQHENKRPSIPDLRGRVTGPDWWHESQSGIPVLVAGLSGKLVEAASLCIGDSIVPQAFVPIAQAIGNALNLKVDNQN